MSEQHVQLLLVKKVSPERKSHNSAKFQNVSDAKCCATVLHVSKGLSKSINRPIHVVSMCLRIEYMKVALS